MNHVMLDLETMGTTPGCAIVSIGAVEFDPPTNALGGEFYRVVSLQSCVDLGLGADADTVMWWLKQSDAARKALSEAPSDLPEVLHAFRDWYPPGAYCWGHGADFDAPILGAAYDAYKMARPWGRKVLDTRTVLWQADAKMGSHAQAHHALADAKYQAVRIMEVLRGGK